MILEQIFQNISHTDDEPNIIERLSDKNNIIMSNNLALSSMHISEVSLNIFLALVSEITMEDNVLPSYDIPLKEIEDKISKKLNRDRKKLDRIIDDLSGKKIVLMNNIESIPLCKKCEVINERNVLFLQIEINPDLHNELLGLESEFTQFKLNHILSLQGFYTKKFYMFLQARKNMNYITVDLDKLHAMFNVPRSLEEKYSNFKARVLSSPLAQIIKLDDNLIDIEYEELRRGHKGVQQLRFVISTIKRSSVKFSRKKKKKAQKEDPWEGWVVRRQTNNYL